jgi:GNAT superfamily N-acetyltransferase
MGKETEQQVVVRMAGPDDIPGVVATSAGLSREDGAARDPLRNVDWARLHAAQEYAKHVVNPDVLVLVADVDGAVVGHLLGSFQGESAMWVAPRAYLISMYVQPGWRGQDLGSRLVEQFTAWAKAKGAVQARVTAYTENEGAARFYRRHGFTALESTFAAEL